MFSKRHESLAHQTWHPSENELLVYLDGEMDAKSSVRVEAHLKGCWSCRVKREETERLISAFMKSRTSALGESSSSPSGACRG
jgi:anti-sigma factor RsiW